MAGNPGYFGLDLMADGREGKECRVCAAPLQQNRLGGRATCWCPVCQDVRLENSPN